MAEKYASELIRQVESEEHTAEVNTDSAASISQQISQKLASSVVEFAANEEEPMQKEDVQSFANEVRVARYYYCIILA